MIEDIGNYCTAKIIGIISNPTLFRNESDFVNYAGVVPMPCSSGDKYKIPGKLRWKQTVLAEGEINNVPVWAVRERDRSINGKGIKLIHHPIAYAILLFSYPLLT